MSYTSASKTQAVTVRKGLATMISFEQKMPPEIARDVAGRVKKRRKERGFTQAELAERAGMSLATYKRFEHQGAISLQSLAAIAIALDYESDFDGLFARRTYASIEEVLNESTNHQTRRS